MQIAALEWLTFGLGNAVRAAKERGWTLHLLTADRTEYAYEIDRSDPAHLVVHDLDTSDVAAVVALLRGIDGLAGLISTTDVGSLVSLRVAAELGLPSQPAAAVELARNKAELRRHLHGAGLSKAAPVVIDPHAPEALESAAGLSYPAVLKDVSGTGSQAVWIAHAPADLPEILAAARAGHLRGGLLTAEPYFTGSLYSAETITWGGRTRLLGISSRLLSPLPHFREDGEAFPVALPPALEGELASWISSVLGGIGYQGFGHTEFILTADGPEVVEVNPRLGGGRLGELICQALDTNIYEAFLDMALDTRPALIDAELTPVRGMAEVFLNAPRTGVFDGFDGAELLAGHPGTPRMASARVVGEPVDSLHDWRASFGSVIAEGPTAELAMYNALAAARLVRVRVS
ncbi:ATP-grasp domain-containing protein [Kitasatospora sp. NPDC051853]|uniref:ATP-grasp domain-containing protein n=1 Tax=Kitasatospora sp. NPDC051853 TaxID=3364058 RepID=UPI0037B219A6